MAKLQVGGTELEDPVDPGPSAADEPLVLLFTEVVPGIQTAAILLPW